MNSPEQVVKAKYPDAFACQAMVTTDEGYEGWNYWIEGVSFNLRRTFSGIANAWAAAAARIEAGHE